MPNTINTIAVKVRGAREELIAAGAITPGHLCKRSSATQVVVHSTQNGAAEKLFAVEDALQGNTVDTAYSSTNRVQLVRALPGDRINALIAIGETITAGDLLVSAGDGTLMEFSGVLTTTTNPPAVIAVAAETLDSASSIAAVSRCLVDIV